MDICDILLMCVIYTFDMIEHHVFDFVKTPLSLKIKTLSFPVLLNSDALV